jgi:hypothetical protein
VVIGVRKIVKNGCLSRTMFESGRKNKPLDFQSLLHPPTHTACPPPCVGLPLASPSLSARTKAKDWLAYASASRLDPTPAVTVVRLQTLRVFRNALCVPAVLKGNSFLFSEKTSKKENELIYKRFNLYFL